MPMNLGTFGAVAEWLAAALRVAGAIPVRNQLKFILFAVVYVRLNVCICTHYAGEFPSVRQIFLI